MLARQLAVSGRVVLKGAAKDLLRREEVKKATETFSFERAKLLTHLQPDGLRRLMELNMTKHGKALKEYKKAVVAAIKQLGIDWEGEDWDVVNFAMLGTAPGALPQIRHKDSLDESMLSVIIAGKKRSVLFQDEHDQGLNRSNFERIAVVNLEEADILIFRANVCHGGGGRRDEEYYSVNAPEIQRGSDFVPIEVIDWMVHGYAAPGLKHMHNLQTYACLDSSNDDVGEEEMELYDSRAETGEDLNCARCQECVWTQGNELLICEAKYENGVHCNRAYHVECLGLDSVPEGRWVCPICVERVRKEEEKEEERRRVSKGKGGKRLRST